jgi:hypothetical protein
MVNLAINPSLNGPEWFSRKDLIQAQVLKDLHNLWYCSELTARKGWLIFNSPLFYEPSFK